MRLTLPLLLSAMLGTACSHAEPPRAATADDAVASGAEAPCGTAQVFFANDSAELDAGARERLDTYVACLDRREIDVVYVAGMTDPAGSEDENLVLGRARALAVADYLHARGVTTDFVVRTLGEEGALTSAPLWPIERSAEVTAIAAP